MDFKEIFNKVSEKEKTDYLFQLLDKDDKLKKVFLNSIATNSDSNSSSTIKYSEFAGLVINSYEEYRLDMENLNLEDTDWENYSPPHSGYIPEWEAAQYMAEQETDELFDGLKEHFISLLFKSKLEELLAELLAFYFASKEADINDPYDNLGDPNDYFLNIQKGFIDYVIEKISISSINNSILINSIKLFFKYFETEKKNCFENIKPFEGLLRVLLNSIKNKEDVKQLSNISKIDKKYFPQYSLQLEKKLRNKISWLENAKQFYLLDNEVGNELLDYYFIKDIEKYVSIAKELFQNNKRYWAEKLALKLKIKHNQYLYKDIYTQLCIDKQQISDYKKIKNILTGKEKENLQNKLYRKNAFRVEIYAEEKQYDEIKQLVERNIESWDFNNLIEPILNIYPGFCFTTIKNKAKTTISNERGRGAYSKIASWLKPAQNISGFEIQTRELILQLYNHKPNLPSLRDEFRGAGLV